MNIDLSRIDKTLNWLKKKDHALFIQVQRKINQIGSCDSVSILNFKNLRHNLSGLQRVHIGSFVLFFYVEGDTVVFDTFLHHDDAYRR